MARIYAAIDEAEAVVFIISPESLASEVCGKELDYAFAQNKRVIPVVHREPHDEVRKDLAELNWIFTGTAEPTVQAVESILQAVDTDLAWVRAHTRLLVRSVEWNRRKRDTSYTLRGSDLREFENWQTRNADKKPRLTRLQSEYLLASRRATIRRQRLTWAAVTVTLIVISVFGTLAWLQSRERARQAEIADARRLINQAEVLRAVPEREQGQRKRSLRAAAQALARLQMVGADTADADHAVRQSYSGVDKWRNPFGDGAVWRPENVAFGSDGRSLALYTALDEIVVLDAAAGEVLAECHRSLSDQTESRGGYGRRLALAPDARHVVLRVIGGTNQTGPWNRLEIWDLDACNAVAKLQLGEQDPADLDGLAFTSDGSAVLYWGRGAVRSWRFAEDEVQSIQVPREMRAFAASPDGQLGVMHTAARGERQAGFRVFELANGARAVEWVSDRSIRQLTWNPGGLLVTGHSDHAIMSPDGTIRAIFAASPPFRGSLSANGKLFAAMTDPRTVEVYAVETKERVARAVRRREILDFAFTANSEQLVVVGKGDFDVGLWHFGETGAYARLLPVEAANHIAFSADSATLHAEHADGRTSWQLPQSTSFQPPVAVFHGEATELRPRQADATARMETASEREVISEANGRSGRRAVLLCSGLTRGGCKRSLEVWDGDSKRNELSLGPVLDTRQSAFLQFAGDDDYLLVATRTSLQILDWQTLESVGELFQANAVLAGLAPGLERAATMGRDRIIHVRNPRDNSEVARIDAGEGAQALALSGDGRWLAVLTAEGRAIDLYALAPRDLISQACRWLDSPCP